MKQDEYNEVLNDESTYQEIADKLRTKNNVLIGWTDENSSHFDILFCYQNINHAVFSPIQGGIMWTTDLFVSVMRVGAFAFDVTHTDTSPAYYSEKLGAGKYFTGITGEKLAELINGVKKHLCGKN